jgi:PAS domain S-box-containing protein
MARDAVLVAGAETGEIVNLNPLVTALTGYSRMELMGRQLRDTGIFDPAELRIMASGLADHETWQSRLNLTNRKSESQAVEAVASGYLEEGRRVFHMSLGCTPPRRGTDHRFSVVCLFFLKRARDRRQNPIVCPTQITIASVPAGPAPLPEK